MNNIHGKAVACSYLLLGKLMNSLLELNIFLFSSYIDLFSLSRMFFFCKAQKTLIL